MTSLRTTIFLICIAALSAASVFAQDDTRATQTWKVQRYDISATLPQDGKDRHLVTHAVLTVTNVSSRSAGSLTLRISTLAEVTSVKINDSTSEFSKSEEKIGSAGSLQRIAMRFPGVAPGAVLTATVDYKLNVKENSGSGALSPAGSQFLPVSFWYPTPNSWFFTRGADHAPFKLTVSGGGATIVSSGTAAGGGFEQKIGGEPFFLAGSWDTVNANGVEVLMPKGTSADGQKRAAELAAMYSDARTFAAGILGAPPSEPLRIVSVRRGAGFSEGGTVLVDDAVFRRPKIDSVTAMSIAEAAAKAWIGNSIEVNGDGYGVILEGLSRYIATEFLESKFGKDVADVERLRHRTAYNAVSKRDAPLSQVSPLDDFFYGEVANKGSMLWRILANRVGKAEFAATLKANMQDGSLTVAELRQAFSPQKDILDYLFDQTTDMNLLVGLPQVSAGETKVALRNTGAIDATVTVIATLANGQTMEAPTTIKALSFGEVGFKTTNKVTRVEVDTDKIYPQTDYSDDIAPREMTDSDPLLAVKRNFDKQDFAGAEKTARMVLASLPRLDDVRALLGRSLLAEGRTAEAEKEFRAVLDEKLPTARSMAWATVGLGEVASKSSQNAQALKFAEAAILIDGEYGGSLAARNLRNKLGAGGSIDPAAKAFFADFDKAAVSGRKADVDALVMPGEAVKFTSGLSGSSEQWQTQVLQVDRLDASNLLVETNTSVKLLTREPSSGLAVYRLTKVGDAWKLSAVDMFEVR